MNLIYKTRFGSHLYGTNTPASDEDYKAIYIPAPREIILQRTKKTIQQNVKLSEGTKNQAGDQDVEIFSFQEFLKLLCEGQTVALDMLFSTPEHQSLVLPEFNLIFENKQKFIHKGVTAYIGYARTQAAKYGLKGGRVAAMKAAVERLERLPSHSEPLRTFWQQIEELTAATQHMSIEQIEGPNKQILPYWNVCDRKMGQTTKVGYALEVFKKVYDNYGHRAKLAEKNENIDWKALLHAVRVCGEAKELLLTGHITFPRPERQLLLQIRKGELPYQQVSEIIEQGIEDIELAKEKSILPPGPDYAFADSLVYTVYSEAVKNKS